eukprot:2387692-Pyramimonas_sp.AAC.1
MGIGPPGVEDQPKRRVLLWGEKDASTLDDAALGRALDDARGEQLGEALAELVAVSLQRWVHGTDPGSLTQSKIASLRL